MNIQESKKQLYEMLLQMKELAEQDKIDEIKILSSKFAPLYNSLFQLSEYGEEAMLYDRARNNFLLSKQTKTVGESSYLEDAILYLEKIPKP